MKKGMSHNEVNKRMFDDFEEESSKKKSSPRRRPIKDWTRAWFDHQEEYEDISDELFKK
jgi:hypothetical protein